MFWRRRDGPTDPDEVDVQPTAVKAEPTAVPRPRRERSGMGLRARPSGLGARLRSILGAGSPATAATWDDVEEALIGADVGAATTLELVDAARERFCAAGGRSGDDVRRALATEIRDRLVRIGSGRFELGDAPSVILFVGVNGTGKTTSLAKLAHRLSAEGHTLALAAADTFRAAAVEQLRIWGEQLGVPVIAQRAGADPGAVAFDAVVAAQARNLDVVLVDTAGRLQNKQQLMDELAKIRRVIERRLPG
ncbi:MAG: signal recognition particle receptor subunit alpha, partial [Chloroflexota bacterium]|nr:signal recognition particle receptor subunit alpha [Chloroflexota bacterium]